MAIKQVKLGSFGPFEYDDTKEQAISTGGDITTDNLIVNNGLSANTLRPNTGKFLSPVSYQMRNADDTGFRDVQMAGLTATTGNFSSVLEVDLTGSLSHIVLKGTAEAGVTPNEWRIGYVSASGKSGLGIRDNTAPGSPFPFWINPESPTHSVVIHSGGVGFGRTTANDLVHSNAWIRSESGYKVGANNVINSDRDFFGRFGSFNTIDKDSQVHVSAVTNLLTLQIVGHARWRFLGEGRNLRLDQYTGTDDGEFRVKNSIRTDRDFFGRDGKFSRNLFVDQDLVLKSPNATQWIISVDNSGNLITTSI